MRKSQHADVLEMCERVSVKGFPKASDIERPNAGDRACHANSSPPHGDEAR